MTEFLNMVALTRTDSFDESEMRHAFTEFDLDRDGLITREEVATAVKAMGLRYTDAQIAEMIKAADRTGDGRVDYEEFIKLFRGL